VIIVHTLLPIRPDGRTDFLAAASMVVQASNAEPGVLEYHLEESVANPNTFTMIERYTDQAALDAHLGSEHFTTAVAGLPALVSGMPKFTKYIADDGIELPLG
jgi:quinol monooxygenase YgiN